MRGTPQICLHRRKGRKVKKINRAMKKDTSIKLFEENKVRSQWDEEQEKWYFSVIDIVAILTEQKEYKKAQSYWTTLKNRLKNEGSEVVTKCDNLKLIASDGKKYLTDVADIETIFRLVQSIPSPKAEPFKLWIAKVARERIDEIEDPEIGKEKKPKTFVENKKIAKQGGTIAGNTRKEIEAKTGKKVVSDVSAKKLLATKIKRINK